MKLSVKSKACVKAAAWAALALFCLLTRQPADASSNRHEFSRIAAGGYRHTIALKPDGTLWAWGWNEDGQLGDGTTAAKSSPVQVGTDNNWTDIYTGGYHSIALKSDGTLWAWGWNGYGQLGDGTGVSKSSPVQIGTDNKWTAIAAGYQHTLAIKSDGTLWAWGDAVFGQGGGGALARPDRHGQYMGRCFGR